MQQLLCNGKRRPRRQDARSVEIFWLRESTQRSGSTDAPTGNFGALSVPGSNSGYSLLTHSLLLIRRTLPTTTSPPPPLAPPSMPIRNFVHRRNHKERSQPTHRARKFGLLEKHKDYVQRARDHHSKRDRIKRLREKALDRNKDEFYFGMVRGKTEVSGQRESGSRKGVQRSTHRLPTSILPLVSDRKASTSNLAATSPSPPVSSPFSKPKTWGTSVGR